MKRIASIIFPLSLCGGFCACGNNQAPEDAPYYKSEPADDAKSEPAADANSETENLIGNGICDPGEKDISVTCDGKDIVYRHADPACSKYRDTTYETASCFKYVVEIAEADNFTFNQKGICSEAGGTPACVLDTDYHCPETATMKIKCSGGYRIKYWNFAACGETIVEPMNDGDSCTEK